MDSGDIVFYIILALSIIVPLIGKKKEKPDSSGKPQPSASGREVDQPTVRPDLEGRKPQSQVQRRKSSVEMIRQADRTKATGPVSAKEEDRLPTTASPDAGQGGDSMKAEPSNPINPENDFQHLDEVKKALIYGEIMRTKF
jgi:hypothetical protein